MRQRKVLDDNEWAGWLQWMRNCFRKGTIKETWKRVEKDRWFNPAFQDFVNRNSWRKSSNLIKNNDYNNKFRPTLKDMWLSF
jgi:hypothetical protein